MGGKDKGGREEAENDCACCRVFGKGWAALVVSVVCLL